MSSTECVPDAETQKRKAIMAIMLDKTLTEAEKARKRQELMMGNWNSSEAQKNADKEPAAGSSAPKPKPAEKPHTSNLHENLKCAICMDLCERPVTAPCQHNFCLACFTKWTNQGKKTCPTCRAPFPSRFAQNPRINTALIVAIRLAKNPVQASAGPAKEQKRVDNDQRPDEAFVTDRAVRAGRANAASGRIMVTTPNDHFGPIEARHDPDRNRGVLVGDHWKDRLDCRQWGAHYPHVAGIAGQSDVGAQSVVLSGGYEDDRDEGEWFLYTGSGGRDLSGNKRTNKEQSFDQDFTKMNKALMLSCIQGLPVRVVRSHKEKRSAYAPSEEQPVRYDGVYRILRCWRKPGIQKFLVCRYLFMRCDNSPAPWSADETGDTVKLEVPEEAAEEIRQAKGKVYEMGAAPYWDWQADNKSWGWTKPSPSSDKPSGTRAKADPAKKARVTLSQHEKALKEFKCQACKNILVQPIRTPCGHNFCKGCLDKKFQDVADIMAPNASRSLRVRKMIKPCPYCNADICEFLSNAQVNREMSEIIGKLQASVAAAREEAERLAAASKAEGGSEEDEDAVDEEEREEEEGADEEGDKETEAKAEGQKAAGSKRKAPAVDSKGKEDGEEEAEGDKEDGQVGKKGKAAGKPKGKAVTKRQKTEQQAAKSQGQEKAEERTVEDKAGPGKEEEADKEDKEEDASGAMEVDAKGGEAGCSSGGASEDKPAPAAPSAPAYKYQLELNTLMQEFPDADSALVKELLDDQAGDLLDVRYFLKKTTAVVVVKRQSKAAKGKGKGKGKSEEAQAEDKVDTAAGEAAQEVTAE